MSDKLPKGPASALHRLFYGSHFTGSPPKLRTFYGPGQPPNAAASRQLDQAGNEINGAYIPPTRWPARGALLRRPQVAWLTVALPYGRTTYHLSYPAQDVVYSGGSLVLINELGGTGGGEFGSGGSVTVSLPAYGPVDLDHPEVAETARIKAAFASAKATIEALRPERTFVGVYDWYDPAWNYYAYPIAGNVLHLTAPSRTETTPYFGTDFAHIFAGAPIEDRRNGFDDWIRILQDNQSNWAALSSLTSCNTRLGFALNSFGSYKIAVYGPAPAASPPEGYPGPSSPTLEFTTYPPLPPPNFPPPQYPPGEIFVLSAFDPDAPAFVYPAGSGILLSAIDAATAEATDIAEARQAGIDVYADQTTGYSARCSAMFAASSAAAPATANVVSVVGTYQDITARSIVERVATIFGFDPDSGEDL